jgi:fructose/tagatose bisphosphate aldolase
MGISKVNVNTEFQLSFAKATREYIEAGKDLEGKGWNSVFTLTFEIPIEIAFSICS